MFTKKIYTSNLIIWIVMVGGQNFRSIFSFLGGLTPLAKMNWTTHHYCTKYEIQAIYLFWRTIPLRLISHPNHFGVSEENFGGWEQRLGQRRWKSVGQLDGSKATTDSIFVYIYIYMWVNNNNSTQHFLDFLANANDIKMPLFWE